MARKNKKEFEVNTTATTPEKPAEEWIWVEGYKGTHKDLTAYGNFQFEMNKVYEMPEDQVDICRGGYHFCLELKDVFGYYKIQKGNRFFKVRGLVRKSEYEKYGQTELTYLGVHNNDKLAAKSIEILWELSPDEILSAYNADLIKDWTYEEKLLALETDAAQVGDERKAIELAKLGYSIPFAKAVVEMGKYEEAKMAASMEDLSMDMKVYLIMSGISKFDAVSRSLKRISNALYGANASAGALSAQLDTCKKLMACGAATADGLRAGVMSVDESPWPKVNQSLGAKKGV